MSIDAMKQALEALIDLTNEMSDQDFVNQGMDAIAALRTAVEQAEKQEPVGEVLNERGDVDYLSYVPPAGTPLYTAPPQRQPLTRKDVLAIIDSEPAYMTTGLPMLYRDQVAIIVRKVERKHGIGGGE